MSISEGLFQLGMARGGRVTDERFLKQLKQANQRMPPQQPSGPSYGPEFDSGFAPAFKPITAADTNIGRVSLDNRSLNQQYHDASATESFKRIASAQDVRNQSESLLNNPHGLMNVPPPPGVTPAESAAANTSMGGLAEGAMKNLASNFSSPGQSMTIAQQEALGFQPQRFTMTDGVMRPAEDSSGGKLQRDPVTGQMRVSQSFSPGTAPRQETPGYTNGMKNLPKSEDIPLFNPNNRALA